MSYIDELIKLLMKLGFNVWVDKGDLVMVRDNHTSRTPIINIDELLCDELFNITIVSDIMESFHETGAKIKRGDYDE